MIGAVVMVTGVSGALLVEFVQHDESKVFLKEYKCIRFLRILVFYIILF